MKIAVEGCCHGELDKIYETIQYMEQRENIKIDLLIICGDFQAVRNRADLNCMAVPQKYQKMNTFYKYYSGEKEAPVLTLFIGGNHEASNYLQELPYGGFVAPKIYYMGYAGVVKFRGLRIAGLSGIFKYRDYETGHHERVPYTDNTKRSVYHIRNLEVFRLKQLKDPVDIMITHDWPRNITNYGNVNALLRHKPFLQEDIESGRLGSPPAESLLHHMKPAYWFAAHLHTKFTAMVKHESNGGPEKLTKFLSLDKCLPRRDFLQVLDMPDSELGTSSHLELDPEWLVILKTTNHLLSLKPSRAFMPGAGGEERYDFSVKEEDLKSLEEDLGGMFEIPRNFQRTAPVHKPDGSPLALQMYSNPWTKLLCEVLGITDPNCVFSGLTPGAVLSPGEASPDENDSVLSDDDVPDTSQSFVSDTSFNLSHGSANISTDPGRSRLLDPEVSQSQRDDSGSENESEPPNTSPRISEILSLNNSFEQAESPSVPLNLTLNSSQSETDGTQSSQSESELPKEAGGPPTAKKFKRRNQSMYSSSD